jgi:acyl-coenzyme A synthetase/AMP-(fatty) acid ligase
VELREHARARLPEYMLPAKYRVIAGFPRTTNGKVDRERLQDIWAEGVREVV